VSAAALLSACQASRGGVSVSAAFRDAAGETGLRFVHHNGMTGQRYMLEMVGPGAALLDYDNDGDLDVFLVQSGPLVRGGAPDAAHPNCRLYRNDLRVLPDSCHLDACLTSA